MKGYFNALILILVCIVVLIPFASTDPDGLEKVAETLGIEETDTAHQSPLPEYTVPVVENEYCSTLIAGVIGVFLVLGTAFILGKLLAKSARVTSLKPTGNLKLLRNDYRTKLSLRFVMKNETESSKTY